VLQCQGQLKSGGGRECRGVGGKGRKWKEEAETLMLHQKTKECAKYFRPSSSIYL